MTKQEKIVVSAYTGFLMCDMDDVHKYIEEKLRRPIYTHELADKHTWDEIREKTKDDFLEICKNTTSQWIPCSERLPEEEDEYLVTVRYKHVAGYEDVFTESTDWYKGRWTTFFAGHHCGESDCILAWMPLPKPYIKEDSNG